MKTLKQILNQNHLIAKEMYYPEITLRSVREWLQQKLDAMPKGEWGEKSMLLELLEELEQ